MPPLAAMLRSGVRQVFKKLVKSLLFLRFWIFCERFPKVVFTEGEKVGVSHAPDVGCPPVTRLVTRYVQNAHLKIVKEIL